MSQAFVTSLAHIEAIAERVRAKVPEQPTKFITGDAFKALITVRHKREAVNALVLAQLQLLDPTIGDAACEMRVPLVLDMLDSVRAILQDGDEELVRAYIASHARDKVDTQVRTVADALGAAHDAAYNALVQRVEAALGEERMDLARLCLTFTKSSVWSEDEFGMCFSFRSKAPMAVAGEEAQNSGNKKDLIQVEQYLRSALAFNAVAGFERKIAEIPRYEALTSDSKQYFIENQLSAAIAGMRSKIPFTFTYAGQAEQHEVPLLPIFNQILAILYMLFNQDRAILFRVRRHKMKPINGDTPNQRYAEAFAGAYVLLWKPNPQTGLFDVVEPTAEDMDCSFIVFDAWSKYIVGKTGTGLDAADLNQHREALKSSNIVWLLLQYAATHPDYTNHAADKDVDYVAGYDAICMPQTDGVTATFKPTREQFPQLHLKMNLPNETRPNLLNLWILASEEGEKRALHENCQAITGPLVRDLYERVNRAVDFQVDHIFATTLKWLMANTDELIAKHASAPDAVFGPYVVRIGDGGFSFLDIKGAQTVLMLKKDNQRKVKCKEIHPGNAAFVKA